MEVLSLHSRIVACHAKIFCKQRIPKAFAASHSRRAGGGARQRLQGTRALATLEAATAAVKTAPAITGWSHTVTTGAYHGASLWFTTLCALSVALGALSYNLMAVLSEFFSFDQRSRRPEQARSYLYGVDVTNSRFLQLPAVLAAVEFAAEAHKHQRRKTGEAYITHCIETALIVEACLPLANSQAEQDRHVACICAAVLHDVVDDTPVELGAMAAAFGGRVAGLVGQVSKLSQMNQLLRRGKRQGWAQYSPDHFKQLRKLIVDLAFEEPLVILIKLADRLHNMRTVYVLAPDKQRSVAEETLEVWCSMAESLGWDGLKSEMEDLCFAVLHPTAYCTLRAELDRLWSLPTLTVVEEQLGEQQGGQGQGAGGEGDLGLGLRIVASTPSRHYTRAAGMRAASGRGRGRRGGGGADGLLPEAAQHERAAAEGGSSMKGREAKDEAEEEGQGRGKGGTGAVADGSAAVHASAVAAGPSLAGAWTLGSGIGGTRVHDAGVGSSGTEAAATAAASHAHPASGAEPLQGQQQQAVCSATTQAHRAPAGGPALGTLAATSAMPDAPPADTALRLPAWLGAASGGGGQVQHGSHDGASTSGTSTDGGGGNDGSPAGSPEALRRASHSAAYHAAGASTAAASATASAGVVARVGVSVSTLESVDGPMLLDGLGGVYGSGTSTTSTTMTSTVTTSTIISTSSTPTPLPGVSRATEGPEEGVQQQAQPLPEPLPLSPGLIAAAPGSPGAVSDRPPAALPAPLAPLLPQQQRLQLILSTVVPFESVGFKDFKGLASSTRRGLEVLDECAALLYNEIMIRSTSGGLGITIQGRLKSLHSVYRKMVRKDVPVAQVYDARALRVIVDDGDGGQLREAIDVAYRLVGAVHSIWKPIKREFDDYIANPKPSGYQALHTAVRGPGGIPMEVQIKTSSMHELAEYGAAAHWVYKEYAPMLQAAGGRQGGGAAERLPVGYEGQPLLKISKDKLRYGVVVAREDDGQRLVAAVKLGATFPPFPTRVPDFSFYASLLRYTRDKGWQVPGHGDFTLRLEEFVKCDDGRYHRRDHMGYLIPAETVTLLEGFEEDALAAEEAEQRAARAAEAGSSGEVAVGAGADGGVSASAGAAAGAAAVGSATTGSVDDDVDKLLAAESVEQRRFREQMRQTFAKTQQLRSMIEWGRGAIGKYAAAADCSASDEVSVLIWPGGHIEHFSRGTTAGDIVAEKGLITTGEGYDGYRVNLLINVNNRLVPEDTVLNDGDLVILAREKVRI